MWELTTGNMFGYTAPEYATLLTTTKVDLYSLGVLLLELVTGQVANAAVADGHLATWAGKHCNNLMENTGDFRDIVDMAIPDECDISRRWLPCSGSAWIAPPRSQMRGQPCTRFTAASATVAADSVSRAVYLL